MAISKSLFICGLQCEKLLWLMKNKKEERVVSAQQQALFDAGTEFGERAKSIFGKYLDVATYKDDGSLDYNQAKLKTEEAIKNGEEVICEASFSTQYYDFCAVDILRKVGDGYEMYEVKSSQELTETHIKDIGYQDYILYKCGIEVKKSFIILNSGNEEEPFKIVEVTARAKEFARKNVFENLRKFNSIIKSKEEVMVEMGEQCDNPYECSYKDYCLKLGNNK